MVYCFTFLFFKVLLNLPPISRTAPRPQHTRLQVSHGGGGGRAGFCLACHPHQVALRLPARSGGSFLPACLFGILWFFKHFPRISS